MVDHKRQILLADLVRRYEEDKEFPKAPDFRRWHREMKAEIEQAIKDRLFVESRFRFVLTPEGLTESNDQRAAKLKADLHRFVQFLQSLYKEKSSHLWSIEELDQRTSWTIATIRTYFEMISACNVFEMPSRGHVHVHAYRLNVRILDLDVLRPASTTGTNDADSSAPSKPPTEETPVTTAATAEASPSAPVTVFISYSHDSRVHQLRVLELAQELRRQGVDAQIDQFVQSPDEGWPLWMQHQIERAMYVIAVCTATYKRRFNGEEEPGKGRGVRWEGFLTAQLIYDADSLNQRVIPVLLEGESGDAVPLALRGVTRYCLPQQWDDLYRRLTDQPAVAPEPLGERRVLAPAALHDEAGDATNSDARLFDGNWTAWHAFPSEASEVPDAEGVYVVALDGALQDRALGRTGIMYVGNAQSLRQRILHHERSDLRAQIGDTHGTDVPLKIRWKTTDQAQREEQRFVQSFEAIFGEPPAANRRSGTTATVREGPEHTPYALLEWGSGARGKDEEHRTLIIKNAGECNFVVEAANVVWQIQDHETKAFEPGGWSLPVLVRKSGSEERQVRFTRDQVEAIVGKIGHMAEVRIRATVVLQFKSVPYDLRAGKDIEWRPIK